MTTTEQYLDHLDHCEQCSREPFHPCDQGVRLLSEAALEFIAEECKRTKEEVLHDLHARGLSRVTLARNMRDELGLWAICEECGERHDPLPKIGCGCSAPCRGYCECEPCGCCKTMSDNLRPFGIFRLCPHCYEQHADESNDPHDIDSDEPIDTGDGSSGD